MAIKADTKKILADSFEDLLKTRSLGAITVQDIVKHCSASRTAFYHHFKDKYELMNWVHKKKADEVVKKYIEVSVLRCLVYETLNYVQEKKEYYTKIITYKGQNSLQDFIISYSLDFMINQLKKELGTELLSDEIIYSTKIYAIGGASIVTEWINSGMKKSVEEMTRLICNSVPKPISQYYD
jgi:probable dihydroxyacetone kinase regulator